MTRLRFAAFALTLAGVVGVALVGRTAPETTGGKMKAAADTFLASLAPEQKKKATFGFTDPHRAAWYFTPQQDKEKKFTRKGARLEEMTAEQKKAALALLRTGTSAKGYEQATTIIGLENLLLELEGPKGAMTRNSGWYFVSIFGDPSNTGKWGWRFEGHHLSVNYTLDKGEVVVGAPMLFASNPAEVKDGAKKGLRPLPEIEDHLRALVKSLDADQTKVAKQAKDFPEIKEGQAGAGVGDPTGITRRQAHRGAEGDAAEAAPGVRRPDAGGTGRQRDEEGEGDAGREAVLRVQRHHERPASRTRTGFRARSSSSSS